MIDWIIVGGGMNGFIPHGRCFIAAAMPKL
jgi:hypothetical protein